MVVSVRTQQRSRRARRRKGDDRENGVVVLDIDDWIQNPEVNDLLRELVKPPERKAHGPLAPPAEDRQGLSYFSIIRAAQFGVELARSFSRRLAAIEADAKDAQTALAAIETLRRSVVAKADGQAFIEGADDGWSDRLEAALKEAETVMRFASWSPNTRRPCMAERERRAAGRRAISARALSPSPFRRPTRTVPRTMRSSPPSPRLCSAATAIRESSGIIARRLRKGRTRAPRSASSRAFCERVYERDYEGGRTTHERRTGKIKRRTRMEGRAEGRCPPSILNQLILFAMLRINFR
jgi:hypothetical protein